MYFPFFGYEAKIKWWPQSCIIMTPLLLALFYKKGALLFFFSFSFLSVSPFIFFFFFLKRERCIVGETTRTALPMMKEFCVLLRWMCWDFNPPFLSRCSYLREILFRCSPSNLAKGYFLLFMQSIALSISVYRLVTSFTRHAYHFCTDRNTTRLGVLGWNSC